MDTQRPFFFPFINSLTSHYWAIKGNIRNENVHQVCWVNEISFNAFVFTGSVVCPPTCPLLPFLSPWWLNVHFSVLFIAFIYLAAWWHGTAQELHSGGRVITHLNRVISLADLTSCITYNCYCHINAPHYQDQWHLNASQLTVIGDNKKGRHWWSCHAPNALCYGTYI